MRFVYFRADEVDQKWLYYLHEGILIRFDPDFVGSQELTDELIEFQEIFFNNLEAGTDWSDNISKEDAQDQIEGFSRIDFVKFICVKDLEEFESEKTC